MDGSRNAAKKAARDRRKDDNDSTSFFSPLCFRGIAVAKASARALLARMHALSFLGKNGGASAAGRLLVDAKEKRERTPFEIFDVVGVPETLEGGRRGDGHQVTTSRG